MIKGHRSITDLDPIHREQHRILFQNCLGLVEKVATTAPTITTLPEGYIQFALISGTMYLYLRKANTIYRVTMTTI